MTRVALLDDHQGVALAAAPWTRLGPEVEVVALHEHLGGDDAVVAALAGFDVVVAMRERTRFDAGRLERLDDLRLLVTTGMGNAAIDLDVAAARGIWVCGTGGEPTATAELTWALILALTRHVVAEDVAVRAGGWQHTLGLGLAGRTLGVIGLGHQGAQVAAIGRAFGMSLAAWSQNLTAERAAEHGAERCGSLDELLERADVATVHLKLSERTTGLIGAAQLRALGPRGYLVNTSRGPIVDEQALLEALASGAIAGAALDVFDREPLPASHPLRSAPHTVLTPHVGYVTGPTYERYYGDALEDVEAWLAGAPVRVLAAAQRDR